MSADLVESDLMKSFHCLGRRMGEEEEGGAREERQTTWGANIVNTMFLKCERNKIVYFYNINLE